MLNKCGYTKIDLLVVIVLVSIVAFITINKTSYAFASDDIKAEEKMINLIEMQAQEYAMDNLGIFNDGDIASILVDDLVENRYMIGNKDGLILNPTDSSQSYNDKIIRLEYDKVKNQVKATMID